jgi:probable rRNA maturation factor
LSIDIANESGVAVSEVALAALARHALDRLHIHPLAELSILLVDEDAMADLHQRWMGEPGATDVLAFPMDELRPPQLGSGRGTAGGHEPEPVPGLLGDVVLCPQIAARQAQVQGHAAVDEVELLCIHGILHLLGYDHAEPEEHARMFGLQEDLLASWRAAGRGGSGAAKDPAGAAPAMETGASPQGNGASEPSGEVPGGRKGPG